MEQNNRPLALVTGASRGIGEAIAESLAKEGYDLVLTCSNSMGDLLKVKGRLEDEYGITCEALQINGSSSAQVNTIFENREFDVLVNNAGISFVGLLHEMSDDEWRRVIGTNLDSVFFMSRGAIPGMLRKKAGKIINISSVWGNVGASMEVAYSTSKGGINAFTKALAKELAPSNITVNAIACGLIDTRMNACFSKEDLENVISEIPADRIGKPDEVAKVVMQLVNSPSYLTGQIVTLDGGWT